MTLYQYFSMLLMFCVMVFCMDCMEKRIKQHTAQKIIEAYKVGRADIIMETIDD